MASPKAIDVLDAVPLHSLKADLRPNREALQKVSGRVGPMVLRALTRAGISQKEAALTMGISESLLARQLAGHEHLSCYRLALLPLKFKQELLVVMAEAIGANVRTTVVVRRRA